MIGYEEFKRTVTERIKDYLPDSFDGYSVDVETMYKINTRKDAMSIKPDVSGAGRAAPVLYLDDLYGDYLAGCDIDDILEDASEIIVTFTDSIENPAGTMEFRELKDRIVPNLIGREFNLDYLEKLPHTDVLDMAVIYRIMMPAPDGGFNSLVIDNHIFEQMDMTLEEMHRMSIMNMKRILPLECNRVMKEDFARDMAPEIPDSTIFVYTRQDLYGAAYMLHDDVMEKLAENLGCRQLYVVPASIHNISVCAAEEKYLEFLKEELLELNSYVEDRDKRLSSNIYIYDVRKKSLEIAASSDAISSVLQ